MLRSSPSLRKGNRLFSVEVNIMIRLFLFLAGTLMATFSQGQAIGAKDYAGFAWRCIGPHRGGRTVGVAGIPKQPNVFFIGVNNGGVWKTTDYGRTWNPIFDDQPTGSIGAVAVAESDPSVIYVGSGEGLQRPDLSVGDGLYKSEDGGKSWVNTGLKDGQQISAVIVDPKNADRAFVAVLGHPYGPNEERGVYRTLNGGKSWEKVLYKDENTGAVQVVFDPKNSNTVYADLWASRQGPWENGAWRGPGSGLFKSTDGGKSWRQLTKGLPTIAEGLGRIGIGISPSNPRRLYATVDANQKGGVYRSDDAGENWYLLTTEGRLWGRGDDFAEIEVDPKDPDVVYDANTGSYKSTDGGRTWVGWRGAPGGDDYHSIWINPQNPDIILLAADQGAVVTVNGGETWSSWYNQPTAQFYHVITDNQVPYWVYGGQQESGSVGIASRGRDGQITFREWHPVGGDEYAYFAPDPLNPNYIYGGKVERFDKRTGETVNVAPPEFRSRQARALRTAPLIFSTVDKHALYFAASKVFKTQDGGTTWETISPDLTRDKWDVPDTVGIYRTPAMATMARRGVVYALGLSYLDPNVIWAGTDDGLVHVTRDGGKTWTNVSPPQLKSWSKVSQIDAGHFELGTAYVSVNSMRLDDWRPHIYRTHDFGKSWQEIVGGVPVNEPVQTVREDPVRKGLLYCGTERAVHFSLDDGEHWQSLRMNMPATSIRDLVVHDADLVVGTHGRSFWILDDISPLRQYKGETQPVLFKPSDVYRIAWNVNTDTPLPIDEPAGKNPPEGAILYYSLPANAKTVKLEVSDSSGTVVRTYSSDDRPESIIDADQPYPSYWYRPFLPLERSAGMHRFVWDMYHTPPPGAKRFPMTAVYRDTPSVPRGKWADVGTYRVRLTVDGKMTEQSFTIKPDPRTN
jgi:photosystem II stability/assembly factor-like uncharacterized protein